MMSKKLSLAIFVMFLMTALFSTNSLLAVDNTVLYLQGEATTIKDTSGKNYQVTVNGNTAISTTQKKFGNSSIYFDGSGDYLTVPNSQDWCFGSGDFTIDYWIYPTTASYLRVTEFGFDPNGTWSGDNSVSWRVQGNVNGTSFYVRDPSLTAASFQTNTPNFSNEWRHIAIVRTGNLLKIFENGVEKSSTALNLSIRCNTSMPIKIGALTTNGSYVYFTGYIDEFRITKGQALWTANFTPPAPAPTVNFSASKDLINYGESVTLNWTTIDASGCTLQYNNTTQVLQLNGNTTVTPSAPTTYTLIATGPGGTTYKELNVKVLNGYTTTGPFTVATKVGIGVMNPVNALEVNGTIKAKEVQVTLNNWPDYVFSQNYDLRSLAELEAFIQKNGRLPGMPSAQELENQGGSVAEILKKQMQKIEELTLYIIRLQKQIEELKKE